MILSESLRRMKLLNKGVVVEWKNSKNSKNFEYANVIERILSFLYIFYIKK